MAEKDITARHLVQFADVFADIVNGIIFILTGRWPSRPVRPEDLVDVPTRTISTSKDKIREQERDVAKIWTVGETVLCLMGLENQTRVDPKSLLQNLINSIAIDFGILYKSFPICCTI